MSVVNILRLYSECTIKNSLDKKVFCHSIIFRHIKRTRNVQLEKFMEI